MRTRKRRKLYWEDCWELGERVAFCFLVEEGNAICARWEQILGKAKP